MKKLSILVSALLIFSIFLSACAEVGETNGTLEPTLDTVGTTTAQLPGTGGTAQATRPLATATMSQATPEVTLQVTETTSDTEMATAVPDTDNGSGAVLLSDLLEAEVRLTSSTTGSEMPAATQDTTETATATDDADNNDDIDDDGYLNGETIGSVQDIVVNMCSQNILWVIVDADDDIIGDRENDLMVPYNALTWTRDDGDNDDGYFVLNTAVDAAVLQGAPDLSLDILDFSAADWDAQLRGYWEGKLMGVEMNEWDSMDTANCALVSGMDTSAANNDDTTIQLTPTVTDTLPSNNMGIRTNGLVLASDLLGMNVVDDSGNDVGDVNDAIVMYVKPQLSNPHATDNPANTGTGSQTDLRYIVVGAGGFLGIGEKNIPVPVKAVSYDASSDSLILSMSAESFAKSPGIDLDELDKINWDDTIDSVWTLPANP